MRDSDVLLEVRQLSVEFQASAGPFRALRNIDFQVAAGETLVILGESGSGKSVTAGAIMSILDRPPASITAGQILYHGRDVLTLPQEERRQLYGRRLSIIFQDPLAHLNPVHSIGQQIMEVFRAHDVCSEIEARRRAVDLLARVGFADPEERARQYPHQFSGGQRQRIMIAMAIALSPELLIADEPTTALDATVQVQILSLIKELQAERGMGLLLITHDLSVAAHMADRVAVMYRGEIVEAGDARSVFDAPRHEYTRRLIGAAPNSPPSFPASQQATPLLAVHNLSKEYLLSKPLLGPARKVAALRGVSFEVGKGEALAIIGESGSGKSTIAKLLVALETPTTGDIVFEGHNLAHMSKQQFARYRRRVQMIFQDPYSSLNPRANVYSIVSEPLSTYPDLLPKSDWRNRVVQLLEMVGLSADHLSRFPHQFSGGQRQRIAIARCLATQPELLICDEAVSALDVSVQWQIIDLLADLRSRLGLSFIFISHDLHVVRQFGDRVIVMKDGAAVESGATDAVFENPTQPYTQQLLRADLRPKWRLGT